MPKDHPRLVASGTIEELNAQIGEILCLDPPADLVAPLSRIQCELWDLALELSAPRRDAEAAPRPASFTGVHLHALDEDLRRIEGELPPQMAVLLPGGSLLAARMMTARAICRRAERQVVTLARDLRLSGVVLQYLNRLGDFLFLAARSANRSQGTPDSEWLPAEDRSVLD